MEDRLKKIEKLTDEQKAAMPRYVEKWLGYGISTEPADRRRAESAIRTMYEISELKPPIIVWCDSPLSMILSKEAMASVGSSVRDSVWYSVRASVGASVWDSVWYSVWYSVRASVWDSVRASVWDSVRASVWDSVWDSVRDSVYGQHEAGWISFYDFFREECGLLCQTDRMRGFIELTKSCGWILPCENICFASERHYICTVDENGLIHNETGPAVAYRDGFEIHAWHGTRVPSKWIMSPDEVYPEEVIRCENVEQRAAGCAIIGWAKIADKLNRRVIDGDPDSDIGALVELTMPGLPEPGRFLMAKCPRNGTICEGVPRTSDIDGLPIDTAIAAQAWRDCLPQDEYIHPEIRF
jgi:hypothetical protein